MATGARRLHLLDGGRLNHYSGLSVFAQYTVVVPESLIIIEKSVPFDVAAMLGFGLQRCMFESKRRDMFYRTARRT